MLRAEGTEGLRADISNRMHLRDLPVVLVTTVVSVVWLATAVAAPSPAAASTTSHASTSLYRLSLRISSKRFLGGGTENPIAVDRHANVYAFKATRTQQGSIPSGDAPDVEEISPAGRLIRSFSTTFRVRGQRRYLQVDGLAVTPNGRDVFVVGNVSKSLSGLVDSRPLLAEYSASTGAFLKSYSFDGDGTRLGVGVAVDPSGRHVYVGDERNPFVGRTTARIYEFDVARLHELRRFGLAGNDVCCDLAVTPDGHLFAQVGPPHSTQVLLQEYSSTGGFENQFASPPGGLAISPSGDLFAGSRAAHRIDRLTRPGTLLGSLGAGHFTGLPVAGAVSPAGDVYAFDAATNDVSTMLKFAAVVPQTTITAHPASTSRIPTATFRFKSSIPGAKLECRLRQAGTTAPAFKPCSSPTTYTAQRDGTYTFEARSTSPVGPVDPSPATFHFKVQLLYPDTAITSTPASTIGITTARFAFKSSSAGATFACRLALVGSPPPAFKPCPSPVTYVQLSDGTWKFDVRAISSHGAGRPDAVQLPVHDRHDSLRPSPRRRHRPSRSVSSCSSMERSASRRAGPPPIPTVPPPICSIRSSNAAEQPRQPRVVRGDTRAGGRAGNDGGHRCRSRRVAPITSCVCRPRTNSALPPRAPPADPFSLDVIDDGDASITYSTAWAQTTDMAAYRGTLHAITSAGTAMMTFSGRSIAVVAPVGPADGSIQICIDPGVSVAGCTSTTLHSATAFERDVVYVSGPLAAGTHTIEITSAAGSPVALDGFAVLG